MQVARTHAVDRQVDMQTAGALPQIRLDASREQIQAYFENGWQLTELLFSGLANEAAFYQRPYHHLRHPLIFYYAHPVVVYVNKLRVAGLLDQPVHEQFETLFEVGVDEMRWDDLHEDTPCIWPKLEEVRAYRAEVYALISNLIKTHPLLEPSALPVTQQSPMWALFMGFEHERIHLETSSVLMRELSLEYVKRPQAWPALPASRTDKPSESQMIALPASQVRLGKCHQSQTYGWDNEYGSETRDVRPFSASSTLISNAEFLEFVKAGGYAEARYWSTDGWKWRSFRNVLWPTFWVQNGPSGSHLYKLRTIFEVIDLPMDWPVCVNFYEAKAYCAWRTEREGSAMPYRLLTEAEHHAIRDDKSTSGNLHLHYGSESAVTHFPANDKGFYDVFGNVWQWCEDHFHPLNGAEPHPYYLDFSLPCYDGEHQMILGGSFISTGDEASESARFHFRPHFFQHAGFRIVRNEDGNPACDARLITKNNNDVYESKQMLNTYMLMHWGSEQERWEDAPAVVKPEVQDLPLFCAELVQRYATTTKCVLDLGCAVGRSSFELARSFEEVIGIDYSQEFIDAARQLQQSGRMEYQRKNSGADFTKLLAKVDAEIHRNRVRFEQGDACTLPLEYHDFDTVLLANVLCRLPEPQVCLRRMSGTHGLVKPGGVLVMTTPFSWLETFTPPARWITDVSALRSALPDFELLHQEDVPFMIREHRRKFEYIIALATVWKRKQ